MMRLLVGVMFVLSIFSSVARAEEYPCPSDPGFCYLDVANDGCFDGGADTGPIDADLEAGDYPIGIDPPGPGSIVCPPSVKTLKVTGRLDWDAAGDLLVYGTKIKAEYVGTAAVDVDGRMYFEGRMTASGELRMYADGDVTIDGRLSASRPLQPPRIRVRSSAGDVHIAERSFISAQETARVSALGPTGKITMGYRVKMKAKFGSAIVEATESVDADSLSMLASFGRISAETVNLTGRTYASIYKFSGGTLDIGGGPTSDVAIEYIRAQASGITLRGDTVQIGLPGPSGQIPGSRLKATFGSVLVFGGSLVEITNAKLQSVKQTFGFTERVRIDATGTDVRVLDSSIKSGSFEINAAAGSTCDITGTDWKLVEPEELNCDTVIGP